MFWNYYHLCQVALLVCGGVTAGRHNQGLLRGHVGVVILLCDYYHLCEVALCEVARVGVGVAKWPAAGGGCHEQGIRCVQALEGQNGQIEGG
jgi:hypothetical protein